MSIDAVQYRRALGSWATGVTIVTARAGSEVHGMTVSDFVGVSLDPPLVAVCVDQAAHTRKRIQEGGCFAVNILAAGQESLASRFASKVQEWQRFEGLDCAEATTGAPLIPGAHVSLDCRLEGTHEGGDHLICVGRVEAVVQRDLEPLLHYAGAYRRLASED